jgi:ABC-type cobalamin/Fe3+-siderophores transport system ATPase subunit
MLMQKLTIHNFGPIRDADIHLHRFFVLIGPQSSGKSTIAKLVYFFLHVRDEVVNFVVESAENDLLPRADIALQKRLRARFLEFFGPTPQPRDVFIRYEYAKNCFLDVTLDEERHRYVSLRFSPQMHRRIQDVLQQSLGKLTRKPKSPGLISPAGRLASEQERAKLVDVVRVNCNNIFGYSKELVFVPAGRSLLSTLSDQVQLIHPHLLDYPMRQFVESVNSTKVFFDRSLEDIIVERQALSTERLRFSAIRRAQSYVKRVLRGEYRYDKEGGKIQVNSRVYTKLSYASSGQQESVWILLILFLLVLEKSRALVIIEEPEAHLFPDAQKEIVEFIAYVFNEIQCDFLVTTHSPYVLASVNNLLYAKELALKGLGEKVEKVIPEGRWLSLQEVGGCFVGRGSVEALRSSEIPSLKTELLDVVSNAINDEFEKLLSIERESAQHENSVEQQWPPQR